MPMTAGNTRLSLVDGFLALFFVLALWCGGNLCGDPGLGWHLRSAEILLSSREFIYSDLFLSPESTNPWIANQWLGDVIFWNVLQLGGWPLLHFFVVSVCWFAHLWLSALITKKLSLSSPISFAVVAIVAAAGWLQWMTRPVIFSFVFAALVLLLILQQREKAWRSLWIVCPALFLLWANIHPAFIIGLFFLGVASLDAILCARPERNAMVVVTVLSALVTLINPYGFLLHKEALGLVQDPYFMQLNAEWRGLPWFDPFFRPAFVLVAALWCAAIGFLLRWEKQKRESLFVWLPTFILIALSFQHRRFLPFLAIAAVVPLSLGLQALYSYGIDHSRGFARLDSLISRRVQNHSVWNGATCLFVPVFILAMILLTSDIPGRSKESMTPDEWYSSSLLEHIIAPGTVFASPNWGGYLTWKLWPSNKVFIDDRNELNGVDRYKTYFRIINAESGWEDELARTTAKWLVVDKEWPLAKELETHKAWIQSYEEAGWVLYERD